MLIYTGIYWSLYKKIYTSRFPTITVIELSKTFCTVWWYNHNVIILKTAFVNNCLTSWLYNKILT